MTVAGDEKEVVPLESFRSRAPRGGDPGAAKKLSVGFGHFKLLWSDCGEFSSEDGSEFPEDPTLAANPVHHQVSVDPSPNQLSVRVALVGHFDLLFSISLVNASSQRKKSSLSPFRQLF